MNIKVCIAALCIAICGSLSLQAQEPATATTITPTPTFENRQDKEKVLPVNEYAKRMERDKNALLIDVRKAQEYESGHLQHALLLDVSDINAFEEKVKTLDKERTYYIYCRTGRRSQTAAKIMMKHDLKVYDLKGGIEAWRRAGLPIEKGPADEKAMMEAMKKGNNPNACNKAHKGCPHSKGNAQMLPCSQDKQQNRHTACQQHSKAPQKNTQKQ